METFVFMPDGEMTGVPVDPVENELFEGRDGRPCEASLTVTKYVLHGIEAAEQVAQSLPRPDDLVPEAPKLEFTPEEIEIHVSNQVRRMLRTIASIERERRKKERALTNGDSWTIDVQYYIIERFPLRPDETGDFLNALRRDILTAVEHGRPLAGDWWRVVSRGTLGLWLQIDEKRVAPDASAISESNPLRVTRG